MKPGLGMAVLAVLLVVGRPAVAQDVTELVNRPWFEARTTHFHTYSCGPTQQVAKLAARLEQFRVAYESLAGTQGVASPPIEVIALPDRPVLEHFLPLYQGQPSNLSGFFHRASDENLIVLSLAESGAGSLEVIFHEYAHLLLRRNQQFWPMWLNEGMADIYSTFEVTGDHSVRIGGPQPVYTRILQEQEWLPLAALFGVTHESPEYNERDRQGIFYAQSWLLTHYLMIGSPSRRAHFGELTRLLKEGQGQLQAFTNAFQTTPQAMQKELAQYLQQKQFAPLALGVRVSLLTSQAMSTRPLGKPETSFRLGDELLRIGRIEEAQAYFLHAAKLAPTNPLAYEGMGLLESERGRHPEALDNLQQAIQHGSTSFLAYYGCAREKLILSSPSKDTYTRLEEPVAAEVQRDLEMCLKLMPDFGPGHHLLGFVELLQGEKLAEAAVHLKKAIELEPENPSYLLTLAQIQIAEHDPKSAQGTLAQLSHPYIDNKLRAHAQELLQGLGSASKQ